MKGFRFAAIGLTIVSLFTMNSCVKQTYDSPPDLSTFDPNLPVNLKIKDLVSPYWGTSGGYRILGDSTIYGIVIADDHSGNFYKQIIIQDSTAGINISVANTYLYNDYPIGRKVYIKLKGLTIISYKGNPELVYAVTAGGSTVTGIPPTLQDTFIVKASFPNTVTPHECRVSDILTGTGQFLYLNTLVKLDDMQFDATSMNLPYALPSSVAISTSRQIDGCLKDSITGIVTPLGNVVLYNSGYADFYNAITPSGYGSITGVYTTYSGTAQFQIRDTTDVNMTKPRCQ